MPLQSLNNGETGLQIRSKINQNFSELYSIAENISSANTANFVLTSDIRLTDERNPKGSAGGDLIGEYPNPVIKNSIALAGQPTAPTAHFETNNNQIATTEFVQLNKGDKFLATSVSTNSISTGSIKTFVVSSSSLSYIPTQDVTVMHDSGNYMHGTVVSYNDYDLSIFINHSKGFGSYSSWTINIGGFSTEIFKVVDGGTY